jgi:transposase
LESTGNTTSVVEILSPHAARVAVANPLQVHLIAKAKTKTDKIDAGVLAKLYGAGFLPEVWTPDEATLARRRQVARRTQLVKHRVRLKAFVHRSRWKPRCDPSRH